MATVFTHGLVAALTTPLVPKPLPRGRVLLALITLAILPDLDVVAFRFGIPYEHPLGHRRLTHSLAFALVAAVLTATLFRRWAKPLGRDWWVLSGLLFFATASHGVLDALTNGGLGVGFLLPFDERRFFFPWRPLAVSPIGIAEFFDGRALRILWTELLWVWLPAVGLALGLRLLRRRAS